MDNQLKSAGGAKNENMGHSENNNCRVICRDAVHWSLGTRVYGRIWNLEEEYTSTTGWTVQAELPAGAGLCKRHDHCQRCCRKQREKRRNTLPSPFSCTPVYSLCPQPYLTRSQWARWLEKCGYWGQHPGIQSKGQGMDLSANRPTMSIRLLPRPALIYLLFLISTIPVHLNCCLQPRQIITYFQAMPCTFSPSLTLCPDRTLSLECFLISLEVLWILQILLYVQILGAFLLSQVCELPALQTF